MSQLVQQTGAMVQKTVRLAVQQCALYPVGPAVTGMIKLDAMENPYPLPEALQAKLAQALGATVLNRYPADLDLLKQKIKTTFQVPEHAQLMLGNGSDELIHLLIQACCEPNQAVLAPSPSFVMYEMSALFNHAKAVLVPLNDAFELDLPAMLQAIERHQPKVIFLSVPNNPTGNVWSTQDIQAIIHAAPGLVVIDEAYQPFTDMTWMPYLAKYPNLLVLRTVSKMGLAGLRLGYLAGSPLWINELEKVRPPYNINVLTEAAALTILDHQSILDEQTRQMRADRAPLAAALQALPGVVVYPSEANFILIKLLNYSAQVLHAELKQQGVLIKKFAPSHPTLQDCLRVSVGTSTENQRFLTVFTQLLMETS